MIKNQTNLAKTNGDDEDAHLQMIKLLLPGNVSGEDVVRPGDDGDVDAYERGKETEKLTEEISMHHVLRDNLYANRARVELSGQIKYRRLQNEAISSLKA